MVAPCPTWYRWGVTTKARPISNTILDAIGNTPMVRINRITAGVIDTTVGYTGGKVKNATYKNHEGHAEAIEIEYDPSKISYEDLLEFFFRYHDPTTLNRQGNDIGSSYRSAIFYHDEEQRQVAERVKAKVNASGKWKRPVVTEITKASEFWTAEDYHQDYLIKNPGGYTCHYDRGFKFD